MTITNESAARAQKRQRQALGYIRTEYSEIERPEFGENDLPEGGQTDAELRARNLAPRPRHAGRTRHIAAIRETAKLGYLVLSEWQIEALKVYDLVEGNRSSIARRLSVAIQREDDIVKATRRDYVNQIAAGAAPDEVVAYVPEASDETLSVGELRTLVDLATDGMALASQRVDSAFDYQDVWLAIVDGFDEHVAYLGTTKKKFTVAALDAAKAETVVAFKALQNVNLSFIDIGERTQRIEFKEFMDNHPGVANFEDWVDFKDQLIAEGQVRFKADDIDWQNVDVEVVA